MKLNSLPGITALETTTPEEQKLGYTKYLISILQPRDHLNPASSTFKQKLVLHHFNFSEPMTLQTSGYSIFAERLGRIALRFQTNQLQVEHRYFAESKPNPIEWKDLNIYQSAGDFHRIVETFKRIYSGSWLGTGASKGGMTSLYHRRFFPNDLDGTIADVAPASFAINDPRYLEFINNVGGSQFSTCRSDLKTFQRTALVRRAEILPLIKGNFTHLGGVEVGFEHAISELPFIFWQYNDPEFGRANCENIPTHTAPVNHLLDFIYTANSVNEYSDDNLKTLLPYFYQAASELGTPGIQRNYLLDLLRFPMNIKMYLPLNSSVTHQEQPMSDIANWLATKGTRILLVYGEYDPWTAGAYTQIAPHNNFRFVVPKGNHSANFTQLKTLDRQKVTEIVSSWLQKPPLSNLPFDPWEKALGKTRLYVPLEEIEFRRRTRF